MKKQMLDHVVSFSSVAQAVKYHLKCFSPDDSLLDPHFHENVSTFNLKDQVKCELACLIDFLIAKVKKSMMLLYY